MVTSDQIKDIIQRVDNLRAYLDIDKKLIEISNEEEKASDPDFWNNSKEDSNGLWVKYLYLVCNTAHHNLV